METFTERHGFLIRVTAAIFSLLVVSFLIYIADEKNSENSKISQSKSLNKQKSETSLEQTFEEIVKNVDTDSKTDK